jgi:hypothetical protein
MRKIILTITFLLCSILTLLAQDIEGKVIKENIIQLQIGLEKGYFKDLNFSPLNYSSRGLAINLGYQRFFKNDDRFFFSSDFQSGELNTAVSDFNTSDHYNLNLEIGYLKNIPNNTSKIKILIGGQFHSYIDVVFYEGSEAVTFYGLHSLDLTGRISWDISTRHALFSTISLPVFGLLVRPPWTGWDKYIVDHQNNPLPVFFRGNWTSLNDFFAFNWDIQYQYAITPRWDLTAQYQFRYYRTEELKTAIIPSNQFTIGTNFKF